MREAFADNVIFAAESSDVDDTCATSSRYSLIFGSVPDGRTVKRAPSSVCSTTTSAPNHRRASYVSRSGTTSRGW